jgi:hypothetical protein
LRWERDEFARHALEADWSVDDERRLVARVTGGLALGGQPVPVRVIFSDGHPYFAPEVYGEALLLGRHQDPLTLNLLPARGPRQRLAALAFGRAARR